MADVFVSYAREDEALAKAISLELGKRGCSVWWDRSLVSGSDFRKTITSEISTAKKVLVIWTRHSVNSHWVLDEAGEALEQKKLVPIKIGNCEIPLGFRSVHALILDPRSINFDGIENALRGLPSPYENFAVKRPLLKRTIFATICILALATAALGATYLFPNLTFRWVEFYSPELGVLIERPGSLFGTPKISLDGNMVTFEPVDSRNQFYITKKSIHGTSNAKDDFENEWKTLKDLGCNTDHIWEGRTSEMCEFSDKHLDVCILSFSRWISARNAHVVSGMRNKRLFYKYTHFSDSHKLIFELIYTCNTRRSVEAMINGIFSRGSRRLLIEGQGAR